MQSSGTLVDPAGVADRLVALPPIQRLVIIVFAAIVTAVVVDVLTTLLVRRVSDRDEQTLGNVVVEELRLPLYASIVLGTVYVSAGLLAALPPAFDRLSSAATRLALSGIVLAWTYASIRVGRRGLGVIKASGAQYSFAPIMKNLWTIGVVVAAFLTLIAVWGIDLTPILATGGVLAIILGIAARDTIANFIGGISLFFDSTYKLGDFVSLESGERGTVVDIGIRSTTILTRDFELVTVPNAVLNTAQVINQSAPERRMRIRIDVRVPYDVDLDVAESCMFEAAEAADSVLESPSPQVRIRQYAGRGIEYELRVFVVNPTRESRARHQVYRGLATAFDRHGIEPPYEGRELRFGNEVVSDAVRQGSSTPARDGARGDE